MKKLDVLAIKTKMYAKNKVGEFLNKKRAGDVAVYALDEITDEIVEVASSLYISGAFDGSGNEIANSDTTTTAVCFNYFIDEKDQEALVKKIAGKSLTIVKIK